MRDADQQFDQVVGDLPFPLPAKRRKKRVADLGRVPPQLARRLAPCALPIMRYQLGRSCAKEILRQLKCAQLAELRDLYQQF